MWSKWSYRVNGVICQVPDMKTQPMFKSLDVHICTLGGTVLGSPKQFLPDNFLLLLVASES